MNSVLEKIKAGQLADHAQEALVKGLLPLDPEDLVLAIFYVAKDSPNLRTLAVETIKGMPAKVLVDFFHNRELEEGVCDFYVRYFSFNGDVLSALLLNPSVSGKALFDVAPKVPAELLDLVVNNQVKILEEPEIVNALRQNPELGINHKQKLDDYERLLFKDLVDEPEELEKKDIRQIEKEAVEDAKDFVKTFGKEKVTKRDMVAETEDAQDDSPSGNVLKALTQLSVPQKVQAAIKGNREVRQTLIRDANKLVSQAVIKSPRITEAEVEFYSNLRSLPMETLRLMAMNREWSQNYKIVLNLIRNPRTPIDMSMKFLSRLVPRDLKQLQMDKGIPEVIRRTAKRMVKTGKR